MTVARILPLMLLALAACKREARDTRLDPPVAEALGVVAVMPAGVNGRPPRAMAVLGEPYRTNAWQLSQGKRLYEWYNCQGCHADGGGNTGPALMDGWWRYGPDAVSVFVSLRDGRPNGMPSFRDRMTTEQLWQLAGYVQSLGGTVGNVTALGRNDAMQTRPGENRLPALAGEPPHGRGP